MFDALSALLPGVSDIRDRAEEVAVQGGWVYAQARGSLDDPASSLHTRDRLGVKWFGTGPTSLSHSPTICSTISRSRGEVSSSRRRICCQVPSVSRPAANGTVSDGPSSAARTWLDPLSSPHLR